MSRTSTKVAVSVPAALYDAVERARKKHGASRSALVQDALRLWLRRREERGLVQQYEAGYRRKPDSKREIRAAQAAAVRLLAAEDW